MMRIEFFGGRSITVPDDQGLAVMVTLQSDADYISLGERMYAKSSVSSVEPANESDRYKTLNLPEGSPYLTDEQRAHNLRKIAEMRARFFIRRRPKP